MNFQKNIKNKIVEISANKKCKRMANILYKLRRRGIKADTKERTIECPYGEDISNVPQVKHLKDEFNFVIQLTI